MRQWSKESREPDLHPGADVLPPSKAFAQFDPNTPLEETSDYLWKMGECLSFRAAQMWGLAKDQSIRDGDIGAYDDMLNDCKWRLFKPEVI
jgi:hypothetical protein